MKWLLLVLFSFLLFSNQGKAAECSLNDVSFFDLNLEQISAIEKSGGNCSRNNEIIDITIESCREDYLGRPTFFTKVSNLSSYNFGLFSLQIDVFDNNGYFIETKFFPEWGGLRPSKQKTKLVEYFEPQGCFDVSSAVISEHFIQLIRNNNFSDGLTPEERLDVLSMIKLNALDNRIKISLNK